MDDELLQKIKELENKRKIEQKKYLSFFKSQQKKIFISASFFCGAIFLIFLLNYFWGREVEAIKSGYKDDPSSLVYNYFQYIVILITAAIVSFIIVVKNVRSTMAEAFPFDIFAKQKIMPLILQEFGENFVYTSKGRIHRDVTNKFEKIIPKHDFYITEDHISGTYHGHRIEFQELVAKKDFPPWLDTMIHYDARRTLTSFSILAIWGFFFTFTKMLQGKTVTFDTPRILCLMFKSSHTLNGNFALEYKNGTPREYGNNACNSEFYNSVSESLRALAELSEKKRLKLEVKDNAILLLIYGTHDLFEIGKLNRPITQQEVKKNIAEAEVIMSAFETIIQITGIHPQHKRSVT
jgi:hypothetical protein